MTTTLLEVMAEVGRKAEEVDARVYPDVAGMISAGFQSFRGAQGFAGADRREMLKRAAAWAILALHAHDAETAHAAVESAQVCPSKAGA